MSSCDYDSTISKAEMVLFHATKFCNPAANVLKNIKKAIDIYNRKGNELPEFKGEII